LAAGVLDRKLKSGNVTLESFGAEDKLDAAGDAACIKQTDGAVGAVNEPNLRLQ
jgi:hypothetical protein